MASPIAIAMAAPFVYRQDDRIRWTDPAGGQEQGMITIQQLTDELTDKYPVAESDMKDAIYAFIDQLAAIDGHNPVHNGNEISNVNADHVRRAVAGAVIYGDL